MRHHHSLTIAVLFAVLLAAPSAEAAEKRFGLTSFDRLVLDGDFAVEVVTRAPVGAVASGSTAALDGLSVETSGGTLTIRNRQFASTVRGADKRGPVTIRVQAAGLTAVSVNGAGSVKVDRMRGPRVMVILKGPGRIAVGGIDADRFSLTMIGNGTLAVAGKARTMQATLSGAGALDASALAVPDIVIDSEGAGEHRVAATRTATVNARGIGSVDVAGQPACTVRNLGTGRVRCGAQSAN